MNLPIVLTVIASFIFCHFGLSQQDCVSSKVTFTTEITEDSTSNKTLTIVDATEKLWHVGVFKHSEVGMVFLCSGTTFHSSFVITAANCVVQVPLNQLRVVAGLTSIQNPLQVIESPQTIYNVSHKFYPYSSDSNSRASDLAILKLENNVTLDSVKLKPLSSVERVTTHCFTSGWGVHYQEQKCIQSNPYTSLSTFFDVVPESSSSILGSILDMKHSLGLSNTFLFNIFPSFSVHNDMLHSTPSVNPTCPVDEHMYLKIAKVSAKAKHLQNSSCANNSSFLCLSSWHINSLSKQIDIGSPVFCKIKKPQVKPTCYNGGQFTSNYGLVGIVTNKQSEQVFVSKKNINLNIISATNISSFSNFIFAVLKLKPNI